MLLKHIKYDLLYNWKFFVGTMAALLFWGALGIQDNDISLTLTVVLFPVLLAVIVLCVVFVLRYYNRSLYGNQGYLTMALPAHAANILAAKAISTTIWFNALIFTGAFSVALFARNVGSLFDMFFTSLSSNLYFLFEVNLSMLSSLMTIYLAITVANTAVRGRRLGIPGGIACYIVWMLVGHLLSQAVYSLFRYPQLYMFFAKALSVKAANNIANWAILLFNIALIAAAFLINVRLIQKKVNLQ